jgi:hypothetical protein
MLTVPKSQRLTKCMVIILVTILLADMLSIMSRSLRYGFDYGVTCFRQGWRVSHWGYDGSTGGVYASRTRDSTSAVAGDCNYSVLY